MGKLRNILAFFICIWCLGALAVAGLSMALTEAAMVRLKMPGFLDIRDQVSSVRFEILSSDGVLMYRKDYSFGGWLRSSDDISAATAVIDSLYKSQADYEKRFPLWQRLFFALEGIQRDTLESFVREYYAKNIVELSSLHGFRKELLQYYIMRRLRFEYSDKELYKVFLDSAHYSGEVHGIVGASKAYFNKDFNELSPLELSYLLARATTNPNLSFQHHDRIARSYLYIMYSNALIDMQTYRAELTRKLEFISYEYPQMEPVILSQIEQELQQYADIKAGEKNIVVRTHYNVKATEAAKKALSALYKKDPKVQAAFVMVNSATGGIEVAIGSRVENSPRNRAISTGRQLGSTFKPFVYATALEKGMLPSEHIVDKQYVFKDGKLRYSPSNYKNVFLGRIPMRYGMVYSLNNATVHLAQKVGLRNVRDTAVKMGFKGQIQPYYAMALGAFATTPLNVAEMYTTIASYGQRKELGFISSIEHDSLPVKLLKNRPKQVLDEVTAYQVMYIMQDVVIKGTARGAGLLKGTAAKTGTSDNSKDLWLVAISHPYVIVLWIGYDDFSAMHEDSSGGNTAAPVVAAFQKEYFGKDRIFELKVPENVEFAKVRTATGLLADPKGKGSTYTEAFNKNNMPEKERK